MPDTVILVPSCDRYRDLWRPFMALLRRNWPDCPYPVYIGSNHAVCDEPGTHTLAVGDDTTWTRGFRAMIDRLDAPVVLLLLEDFFFRAPVNTARVDGLRRDFDRLQAAYLRLFPEPPPDLKLARFPEVGEIAPGAPYRTSLQAAFWRVEDLRAVLRDDENVWQMEVLGSRRSDGFDRGFYSVWETALDYYNGVIGGRWDPYAIALCREQGVPVDLNARSAMSAREVARYHAQRAVTAPWRMLPWTLQKRLLRWFRATGLRKPHPGGY